eukprot:c10646_g2_i1 orf=160-462(+)
MKEKKHLRRRHLANGFKFLVHQTFCKNRSTIETFYSLLCIMLCLPGASLYIKAWLVLRPTFEDLAPIADKCRKERDRLFGFCSDPYINKYGGVKALDLHM